MRRAIESLLPCRIEQAVYGSFPFWNRGYGILARSSGCKPEWLAAFKSSCQRFGERPHGTLEAEAFFAKPLASGPWMIVGVYPRGRDDTGRPGTTVFHALFTTRWHYALRGSNPFLYSSILRGEWKPTDIDQLLPTLNRLQAPESGQQDFLDPQISSKIIDTLEQGNRVLVVSSHPIDSLSRCVWQQLSWKTRRNASVATLAYANASDFQLAAVSRISTESPRDFALIVEVDCHSLPKPANASLAQLSLTE